jgi:ankyrin repeat protein
MSKIALMHAIDKGDIDAVGAIIADDNFNNDFNHIAPNGASALWWALMPPMGKSINLELVKYLLDYVKNDGEKLVNPTQEFAGFRPNEYLGFVDKPYYRQAWKLVIQAENHYVTSQQPTSLAQLAKDAQNVHSGLVTGLSKENMARLYHHYAKNKIEVINTEALQIVYGQIEAFINAEPGEKKETANHAFQGLKFCANNNVVFDFPATGDISSFSLTLMQMLSLNWMATKEGDSTLLPEGAKDAEKNRKESVLNTLYDNATAYGLNEASCAGGAATRFGMTLAGQHNLVHISNQKSVKGEMAQIIITRVLGQLLEGFAKSNPENYLAVMRHLILSDESNKDEHCYTEFIADNKVYIEKKLAKERVCIDIINDAVGQLFDAFPVRYHQSSYQLFVIMNAYEELQFDTSLFDGNMPVPELLEEAKVELETKIIECEAFNDARKQFDLEQCDEVFKQEFVKAFTHNWLNLSRNQGYTCNYRALINNTVNDDDKPLVQEAFVLAYFSMVKQKIEDHNPSLADWLNGLAASQIIDLIDGQVLSSDIDKTVSNLIIKAISLGFVANLTLDDMEFIDADLRGIDFSKTTLRNITFTRCLLPISGTDITCEGLKFVDCQLPYTSANDSKEAATNLLNRYSHMFVSPSIKPVSPIVVQLLLANISSVSLANNYYFINTLLEASAKMVKPILERYHFTKMLLSTLNHGTTNLMFAAEQNNIEVVNAILESEYCTHELLEQIDDRYQTALIRASTAVRNETVKAILNSKHCTEALLAHSDVWNSTALMNPAYFGHIEIVKAILDNKHCTKGLLAHAGRSGKTALIEAADHGHIEVIKTMLASKHCTKELIEHIDSYGVSVLIEAARNGHTEVVMAILASKHCTKKAISQAITFLENKNKDNTYIQVLRRYFDYHLIWESIQDLESRVIVMLKEEGSSTIMQYLRENYSNEISDEKSLLEAVNFIEVRLKQETMRSKKRSSSVFFWGDDSNGDKPWWHGMFTFFYPSPTKRTMPSVEDSERQAFTLSATND